MPTRYAGAIRHKACRTSNHYLIIFKAHCMTWNTCLTDTAWVAKNLRQVMHLGMTKYCCSANGIKQWNDSMEFYYTHRSVSCQAIIKGAFSCSRWEQTPRPTGWNCEERIRDLEMHSSKCDLPLGLRKLCGRGSRKTMRASGENTPNETVPSRQKLMYIWTPSSCSHMQRACTVLRLMESPSADRKVDTSHYP